MPLDLDPIQEFVEEEMTDTCSIARDPEETVDDTYDEETAVYTPAGILIVYSGKCFLSTQGWQPGNQVQGGAEVVISSFKLVLPVLAATIKLRDIVTMTKSVRDPRLKDQQFIVDDRIDTSHAISQNLLVSRVAPRIPL